MDTDATDGTPAGNSLSRQNYSDGRAPDCLVNGEKVSVETYEAVKASGSQRQPCGLCGRPIFFRQFYTNQSRWMPIDYTPDNRNGNIVLVGRQQYRVLLAVDLKNHRPAGQIRYTSHMHTCPHRAKKETPHE